MIERGRYRCGCSLVEDDRVSTADWQAFKPNCPAHGENIDWSSMLGKLASSKPYESVEADFDIDE